MQLEKLFKTLAEKENTERCGQLPAFINSKEGYFFAIRWEEDVLYFETRWAPNTEIIKLVADRFSVDFTHFYEELGCLIYGEATYKNKVLSDIYLDPLDFDSYYQLDGEDKWFFNGETFESDLEILEILLQKKQELYKKQRDKK
jgi:hypothetical protein